MGISNEHLKGYMTLQDFTNLLNHIEKNHTWKLAKGRMVKYINPCFDMRIRRVFAVKLRGAFGEKDFAVINENKDKDLYTWITNWLDEKEIE